MEELPSFHRLEPQLALGAVCKLYEERGKKRTYDMACGENQRCFKNSPKSVQSHDELCKLYGDRYINLTERVELMNTYTCKYSYSGRKCPADLMKMKMTERSRYSIYSSANTNWNRSELKKVKIPCWVGSCCCNFEELENIQI